jgi:hypothetical protein
MADFMRRRGYDAYERPDLLRVVAELVDEGLVPRDHRPTIAVLENEVEPAAAVVAYLKAHARSR